VTSRGALPGVSWNLIAGATAGASIVFATPWYVRTLGLQGFGVVGLWLTLQLLVGFLDLGFGAALMRRLAVQAEGPEETGRQVATARSLESVVLFIAVGIGVALLLGAQPLLDHWLRWSVPVDSPLVLALRLMGLSIALQFPSLLYTSGLLGLHRHQAVSLLQGGGALLRHGGGVAIVLGGGGLVGFFALQAAVSFAQTTTARLAFRGALGHRWRGVGWVDMAALREVRSYSAGMALTSLAAVALGNADRLLASRMLSAEAFGGYAIAFTAAGLLQLGIQPFYRTYFPRFTRAVSAADPAGIVSDYFAGSRLLSHVLVPIGVTVLWFAPDILQAWVGRAEPEQVGVLRWLTVGVAMAGLGWLPAALQQAHGWTQLHFGMMLMALGLGTLAAWAAFPSLGARAATLVWLVHGGLGLSVELALMHRRVLRGWLLRWYRIVLLAPLLVALPVVGVVHALRPAPTGRLAAAVWPALALGLGWAATLMLARRTPLPPVSPSASR